MIPCLDMWAIVVRYLKFAGSSIAGTVTDTLVLWLLSSFVFGEGYWGEYVVSPAISFQCAVAVNYTIAYFFVWKDRVGERSVRGFCTRFLPYNVSCIAAFLIKMIPFVLIRHFAGLNVVLCNLIALCLSGIFNFVMNEWVIFRKKS